MLSVMWPWLHSVVDALHQPMELYFVSELRSSAHTEDGPTGILGLYLMACPLGHYHGFLGGRTVNNSSGLLICSDGTCSMSSGYLNSVLGESWKMARNNFWVRGLISHRGVALLPGRAGALRAFAKDSLSSIRHPERGERRTHFSSRGGLSRVEGPTAH